MTRSLCLALALISLSAPVLAQSDTETWDQTEVVVTAKRIPGPALWRIRKGESEVIILGILPVFPERQAWNTKRVENALRGANALITPATSQTGAGDVVRVLRTKGLPEKQTLKAEISPELYARYEATARRAGVSIKDFARDKPVWAGARLRREVLQKRNLTDDQPTATLTRLARKAGVKVKTAGKYRSGPVLKDLNLMSEKASQACLSYTLDDIDFNLDRAPKAAAAWAVGDIKTVRANYQGGALMKCFEGSNVGAALLERSIDDTVSAISGGLQAPGKTVVIVSLSPLLRKGGALDRLRMQGYSISAPDY